MDWGRFDGLPAEAGAGPFDFLDAGDHSGPLFQEETPREGAQWQIPWSDLMMTMFILFAVMYVYASSRHTVAPPPEQKVIASPLSHVYELSRATVKENHLEKLASVELVPNKAVRILLTSDLLFDPGRADLKQGSVGVLKQVATILRKTPYLVNLVGHTDNIPIHNEFFPSNWELSTARACAVARFLIEQMKIAPERFRVSGYADCHPLRANVSSESRAANRRVEIIITKETM
jgi:flagellar motor protein MotB